MTATAALPQDLTREATRAELIDGRFLRYLTGPVTRGTLEDAFNRVCDEAVWKNPIDRVISATFDDIEYIREAVSFYAGCEATIEIVTPVLLNDKARGLGIYRVTAIGYYAAVGS